MILGPERLSIKIYSKVLLVGRVPRRQPSFSSILLRCHSSAYQCFSVGASYAKDGSLMKLPRVRSSTDVNLQVIVRPRQHQRRQDESLRAVDSVDSYWWNRHVINYGRVIVTYDAVAFRFFSLLLFLLSKTCVCICQLLLFVSWFCWNVTRKSTETQKKI